MQKSVLIISPYSYDKPIIKSLSELDYRIFGIGSKSPLFPPYRLKHLENIVYNSEVWNKKTVLSRIKYQRKECIKLISKQNISFIFPSSSVSDGLTYLILGYLNSQMNCPGLNQELSRFWYRKSSYLKHFKKLGVRVPTVFQKLSLQEKEKEQINKVTTFPVICKPDCGSGSIGVFAARSKEELHYFFEPDSETEQISHFEKSLRCSFKDGKNRKYFYNNCHSAYLVEEFIPGSVLSVAGIKAVNGIEVSLIYKIVSTALPFRSEKEYLVPFSHDTESIKTIHDTVTFLVKKEVFPYGPFMFDFILDPNKKLYLIDSSPRINIPSMPFFELCYKDKNYIKRCIDAFLEQKINIQSPRKTPIAYLYFKYFPLKEGIFIKYFLNEAFSEYVVNFKLNLKPGDPIWTPHDDYCMERKGELAVIGRTMEEAKSRWFKEFKKLSFKIKDF